MEYTDYIKKDKHKEDIVPLLKKNKRVYLAFFRDDGKDTRIMKQILLKLTNLFANGCIGDISDPYVHVEIIVEGISYIAKAPNFLLDYDEIIYNGISYVEKIKRFELNEKDLFDEIFFNGKKYIEKTPTLIEKLNLDQRSASSIIYTEKRTLKYKRKGYEEICYIEVDEKNFEKIKFFLNEQIGKPFNVEAFRSNFIPIGKLFFGNVDNNGNKWFCSELVTAALQHINEIDNSIKSYLQTPQSLFEIVKNKIRTCNVYEATDNDDKLIEEIDNIFK